MANIKLKKKKESGYEVLYPQTLGTNVITGTGNVQTDISNLMNELTELKKEKQIIEVQFKLEKETFETEDLAVLNLYDFSNNKIIYDKTKKYYGKLVSKDSYDFQGADSRIYFNDDYYYLDLRTLSNGNAGTTSLKSESLSSNQIIYLDYFKEEDMFIVSPDSINSMSDSTASHVLGNFTKGQINTLQDTYVNNHTRVPYIFNAVNTYSNTLLMTQLLQLWNRNSTFCLIRNLKFDNYDFAGSNGNVYGNVYFKLRRESADIPLDFYTLNVSIEFNPAKNNIYKLERNFSVNKNATTGVFTFSSSEVFYDESKWTFHRENYYTPITALIDTFPNKDWIDWVDIDPKATNLLIVLEHVGNLIATFDVSLRVLKIAKDYQYNLNAGTTWNAIRLHGNKIQISSPTNGENGTGTNYVKLVNAFFYK